LLAIGETVWATAAGAAMTAGKASKIKKPILARVILIKFTVPFKKFIREYAKQSYKIAIFSQQCKGQNWLLHFQKKYHNL
jgi:hypothetical protein